MFTSTGPSSPNRSRFVTLSAAGLLLSTIALTNAGCGFMEQASERAAGLDPSRPKPTESCSEKNDPNRERGSIAMRAAAHNNRITSCVLIPSNINLSALDQLLRETKRARSNSPSGNPSATGIIRSHYRTDFGLPDADTPREARDALVDGKSFKDVTKKILKADLPYLPGGLVVLGTDDSGELDVSLSMGSNSQSENKAHKGRAGLLNSDGMTDSIIPIEGGRLSYVLAPVGKSRPRG